MVLEVGKSRQRMIDSACVGGENTEELEEAH